MSALVGLGLAEAAGLLERREVSAVELVEAQLANADRWEPAIRSLAHRADESARAAARDADAELAAGRRRGPLHGIPLTVKDLVDVAGLPMEAGSRVLAGNVAARDAHAVERLREAGAIVLGKARTHEFAFGGYTPPARNPWDVERIPGGSSGGSGAGVAAGIGYASLCSDTAGSVRSPASFNGCVGLKPTYGRIGRSGVVPMGWTADTLGVIARSALDVALVLDAIAGPDPRDETSIPTAHAPAAPALEQGIAGLRVGVVESFFAAAQADVEAAQRRAIGLLADAGATVVEVALEPRAAIDATLAAVFQLGAAEAAAWHADWLDTRSELYGEDVLRYITMGRHVSAVDYLDAQRIRRLVSQAFAAAFRDVDLLVTPSHTHIAPRVDEQMVVYDRGEPMHRDPAGIRCLCHVNMPGLPALSVPVGLARGLPVGLQVIGPPLAETLVLRAARAVEARAGFLGTRPTEPA